MPQKLTIGGRYKAKIEDHAVCESTNGFPQIALKCNCYEQEAVITDSAGAPALVNGQPQVGWVPLGDAAGNVAVYEITDYLILGYKDSETGALVFSNSVQSLIDATGWQPNPQDPWGSLAAFEMKGKDVQLVVEAEEYQNKTRLKIKFLNPLDYEGTQFRRADASTLSKLNQAWGSLFRSKFASKAPPAPVAPVAPAAAAPPVAALPPKPPPKPVAPAAPAIVGKASTAPPKAGERYEGGECTLPEAYQAFVADAPNAKEDMLASEFYRHVREYYATTADPDPDGSKISGAQCAYLRDHHEIIPF